MPWVWVRRDLAKGWNCPPWEVDEHDDEAELELRLRAIEAEAKRYREMIKIQLDNRIKD